MSDYLKVFNTVQEQTAFRNGSSYVNPHVSCTIDGESLLYNKFNNNGYDYVDLGLPSGTLWAICNVGASSPEDFGNFYAWGETETKSSYSSSTYNDDLQERYSYEDILMPEDDVAHVVMGGDWKMPTVEDFYELKYNTTISSDTVNNVPGIRVTGLNGNSIFFPYAGYYEGSSHYDMESQVILWLSDCSYAVGGNYGYFYDPSESDAYYGWSVRGVIVLEENTIPE